MLMVALLVEAFPASVDKRLVEAFPASVGKRLVEAFLVLEDKLLVEAFLVLEGKLQAEACQVSCLELRKAWGLPSSAALAAWRPFLAHLCREQDPTILLELGPYPWLEYPFPLLCQYPVPHWQQPKFSAWPRSWVAGLRLSSTLLLLPSRSRVPVLSFPPSPGSLSSVAVS